MRNPNKRRITVVLPRDKQERFKHICGLHNVYPATVLRSVIERVIEGSFVITPDIHKKPPSGAGAPIRKAKRKRSASA